ncbi:MAG: hypothetical protein J2O48_12285, partial [Solirubrobacterales bacterium]|nr:hypothetical protein [Solirubrobacterales bacterium]
GLGARITTAQLAPFLNNMHFALWCLCGVSVLGAIVSLARPKHQSEQVVGTAHEPVAEEAVAS